MTPERALLAVLDRPSGTLVELVKIFVRVDGDRDLTICVLALIHHPFREVRVMQPDGIIGKLGFIGFGTTILDEGIFVLTMVASRVTLDVLSLGGGGGETQLPTALA